MAAWALRVWMGSLAFLLVLSAGCGGGSTFGETEADNIALDVAALADAAENEEMFSSFFTADAVPEDRLAYASRTYDVAGPASISGDTATVTVLIGSGMMGSASDTEGRRKSSKKEEPQAPVSGEPQEVQWTLQRVDDGWKISEAPLP